MIEIEQIVINGLSTGGAFAGVLKLESGLQIISGGNHYGKSLTATVIAWCLAVEPMFGISDNQPICFPEAARERLDLGDGTQHLVTASRGGLFIKHSDGRRLQLWRAIKGDTTVIDVREISSSGNVKTIRLNTRFETMQDSTGGMQFFFFEWMGWPREKVSTFRGEASIYLENLAPLFYIDQAEGWTNIQALQISRYGQQKISETAVEYLLGASDSIRQRFATQQSEQRDQSLRDEAHSMADRVRSTLLRFGWDIHWSGAGTISSIHKRWSDSSLSEVLLREADVDVSRSQKANIERTEKLRSALTEGALDGENSTPSITSQTAINLKTRRNELNKELNSLRLQRENADQLIFTIQHKLRSAADLLRYKKSHVGRLEIVECPTCHRDLDAETFSLQQQSEQSVEAHIQALNRDRILMVENVNAIVRSIFTTTAELAIVDEQLRTAESALRVVTDSTTPAREQMAKLAIDLSAAEREYQRLQDVANEIESLQLQINAWIESVRHSEVQAGSDADLKARIEQFSIALLEYLRALGHMALMQPNPGRFYLDAQYTPYLDGRRLRSLGSASDQSRLVAAYTLALAVTAEIKSGYHPGFVILDEPLQQNPDPKHRELFVQFLVAGLPSTTKIQVVIFTNLTEAEIKHLRAKGREVQESQGEHFLQLIDERSVPLSA
jgi:hypothetical protein